MENLCRCRKSKAIVKLSNMANLLCFVVINNKVFEIVNWKVIN